MRAPWIAATMSVLVACSDGLDGPTPEVTGVEPNLICTAQQDQIVTIEGSGFSPAVVDGLEDSPQVMMPRVFLASAGGEVEVPPEHVALPDGDRSGTALQLTLPAGFLDPSEPGQDAQVYDIRVQNSNENDGTLADALTVVPPPEILSIDPDNGPAGSPVDVTLTGTGFRDGMTITLDANPPVEGQDVTVASSTEATATFDLEGVEPGTYSVTVTNTDGCSFTLEDAFTVVSPIAFDLVGIEPPFGCTCERTSVTITSDDGFVSTPRVEMRPVEGGSAVRFERVAFVDASTITAVVPAGAELGDYDVTVFNPPSDGGVGTLEAGFRVVAEPVPSIEAIVPARGEPNTDTAVSIFGENFRNPVQVELIDRNGDVATTGEGSEVVDGDGAPLAEGDPGQRIDSTLPLDGLAEDIYLVRVTNLDEGTFSTFSNFQVAQIGPSGNLAEFEAAAPLNTGRRMLAATDARDTLGNRHLYAIGGDTGDGGEVLDTVESAQLGRFGNLGSWNVGGYTLNTPRVGAAAVTVPVFEEDGSPFIPEKSYLYVLGGMDGENNVLNTIERALVLSPDDAPRITSISASAEEGSLEAGTWYYKVSAILSDNPAEEPDNPGGETLPSDEAIITIGSNTSAIDLEWEEVVVNGTPAVAYRIYRTAEVNGVSQTERLLDEVPGTSYTDSGGEVGEEVPLPIGSTGVWVTLDESLDLAQARWGHQAAFITDPDPEGGRFIHVLGGRSAAESGYLDSVEVADVADDGSLFAFDADRGEPLTTPRSHFSLAVQTQENVSGFAGVARLVVMGGIVADGGVQNNQATNALELSEVLDTGVNDTWIAYEDVDANYTNQMGRRAGTQGVITSEKLFIMGGAANADDTSISQIIGQDVAVHFDSDNGGEIGSPFSDTGEGNLIESRALGAVVSRAGFIFFLGGTSNGTDALASVERSF
jgi:hypothetical protein